MMVVTSTDAFADVLPAAARLRMRSAVPFEFRQQVFRYGFRIAQHSVLHWRVIAKLCGLNVDLDDRCIGGDQLALFGGPRGQTRPECEDQVALRNEPVGHRRGKTPTDSERPRI